MRKAMNRDDYLMRAHEFAPRGADLPHTKLTPEIVRETRAAAEKRKELLDYIRENLSNAALAKKHGVHIRTIERASTYENFRQVL